MKVSPIYEATTVCVKRVAELIFISSLDDHQEIKIIPTSQKRERDVQRRHYSLGATASSNLFFLMVLCLLILTFWSIYKNN